ncbi:MAG: hypothetical protein P8R37_00415 [Opitutae bacterium]|nr:hypothetical protein [Opitutae bacterium]MDG1300035.1 hypothetical protein [Opitutae bacterium]
MDKIRINILHHRHHTEARTKGAIIRHLARKWKEEGHVVTHLYGCDKYESADVLILHIDLSCIPDEYVAFSQRFPKVVNLGLTDIRKRTISRNLLSKECPYEGPVIIKADLNCGGAPERLLGVTPKKRPISLMRGIKKRLKIKDPFSIRKPKDYLIYPKKSKVPRAVFSNESLVVEKFLPEKHGDEYYQRRYYFFGDAEYHEIHATSVAIHATDSDDHCIRYWEEPSIPPALRSYRKELQADYGKIDYVIHDGKIVVFDVNRTPSSGDIETDSIAAVWVKSIVDRLHVGIAKAPIVDNQ